MTNDEIRMTKECSKDEARMGRMRLWALGFRRSFVILILAFVVPPSL